MSHSTSVGQRTTRESASLPPHVGQGSKQATRLGSKHLFPLTHLTGPNLPLCVHGVHRPRNSRMQISSRSPGSTRSRPPGSVERFLVQLETPEVHCQALGVRSRERKRDKLATGP